jgi:hypothetical protein
MPINREFLFALFSSTCPAIKMFPNEWDVGSLSLSNSFREGRLLALEMQCQTLTFPSRRPGCALLLPFLPLCLSPPYSATLRLGYPQIFLFLGGNCGARILDWCFAPPP